MVTSAVLSVLSNVVTWVLGLIPHITLPTYLTATGAGSLNGTLTSAVSGLWSIDAFIPVTQLIAAAVLVLAALGLAVTVRGPDRRVVRHPGRRFRSMIKWVRLVVSWFLIGVMWLPLQPGTIPSDASVLLLLVLSSVGAWRSTQLIDRRSVIDA